ncbi:MAG: exonuclease domain-containing protein [Ilumatobacteraceae bacterium]
MTQLHEVTFCVLDLETTGTDPGWDDITEVGAILVRGGERLGTFHTLVGPAAGGGSRGWTRCSPHCSASSATP